MQWIDSFFSSLLTEGTDKKYCHKSVKCCWTAFWGFGRNGCSALWPEYNDNVLCCSKVNAERWYIESSSVLHECFAVLRQTAMCRHTDDLSETAIWALTTYYQDIINIINCVWSHTSVAEVEIKHFLNEVHMGVWFNLPRHWLIAQTNLLVCLAGLGCCMLLAINWGTDTRSQILTVCSHVSPWLYVCSIDTWIKNQESLHVLNESVPSISQCIVCIDLAGDRSLHTHIKHNLCVFLCAHLSFREKCLCTAL